MRLAEQQLQELEAELGVVAPVAGLTRVETQVLAALARAPRGLVSARAVARRACVCPTAAAAAVRSLAERGLVRREREWVAAGRAREIEVIHANVSSPKWPALAPGLSAVRLPLEKSPRHPTRVPSRLRHVFWNADPGQLDLRAHGDYIAARLLSTHDLDGLAWGLLALRSEDWGNAAGNRGLSAREKALARNLAQAGRQ